MCGSTFYCPGTPCYMDSTYSMGTPSYNLGPIEESTSMEMSPELLKSKEYINTHAICLQEEVAQFIGFQVKLNGVTECPRLPIFFLKSFNFLKNEANRLNLKDKKLDNMWNAIYATMIVEYGPGPFKNFPRQRSDGLLDDQQETLATEVDQFFNDITDYLQWSYRIDGFVPLLPKAYHLTLKAFEQRLLQEEYTEENMELFIVLIENRIQAYLSEALGDNVIDKDYVNRCTCHYEKTLNPGQLDSLKINIV